MSSEQRVLVTLATEVGAALLEQQLKLVTAESCTGGGVAQAITMIPGSSQWFERGYVTYSNAAKIELLEVSSQTLDQFGAVSELVAQQMAEGALRHSHAQVSIATTGIAGPDGGSETKPVGMVCFAWAFLDKSTICATQYFSGSRLDIQQQAVEFILQQLVNMLL